MIRVLLADDHGLFRRGVAAILQEDQRLKVVGEARHGAEAVDQAMRLRPDVVLMDLDMPFLDGIHATRQIKGALPECRVVVLTYLEEDEKLFAAVRAGADGYLLKDLDPSQLPEAVCAVVRGEAALPGRLAARILREFARGSEGPRNAEGGEELTPREREVLQLVAEGKTTKQISALLKISPKTVEFHRNSLMEELGVRTTAELTRYAVSRGIVL